MSETRALVGFIGGTGVYGVEGLQNVTEIELDTPFGKPSSKIMLGEIHGVKLAFIARHGSNHRFLPSEVPFRANIYALKLLGVKYLLSFGASGSLKEEFKPLDIVLVDQIIDRTSTRASTFFGDGIIAHVAFADPVCLTFQGLVYDALSKLESLNTTVHRGGTYVCIEGPAFSSRAESNMYRHWGGQVIGMSAIPEAKLAREAEMAYVCVALITDYDCWHPGHESVTVELVVQNLRKNSQNAQIIVQEVVKIFTAKEPFASRAHSALQHAILTPHHHIPAETLLKLGPLIQKYLPPS